MAKRRRATIELLVGGMGSGKTYQAIQRANSCKKSVWVWDAVGEWSSERLIPDAAYWNSLAEYRAALSAGQKPVQKNVVLSTRIEWEAFLSFAYQSCALRGGGMVIIEELQRWVRSGSASTGWQDMVDRARHAGVDLVGLGPRLMAFPIEVRAQASHVTVFQTTDPDSLLEIRRRTDAATAEKVRRLRKHQPLTLHLT